MVGAAGTFALLVALTVPFDPRLLGEWIGSVLDLQGTSGSNATVWTIGRVLPGGPLVAGGLALLAVAAFLAWWRIRRPDPATVVAASVPASLFVAPHGWSYDGTLLLLTLAAILGAAGSLAGARRVAVLIIVAATAVAVPWALYAVALARGGEEWSALTPVLFFAVLAVTPPRAAVPPSRPTP